MKTHTQADLFDKKDTTNILDVPKKKVRRTRKKKLKHAQQDLFVKSETVVHLER